MADARDVNVWTNHAVEQWEENKTGHSFNEDYKLRKWLKELGEVGRVVDLGCGGALWRKLFSGYNYTGVDQNENMLKYAELRFPDDRFVLANGMELPFEDGSIDLVFTSAVLQHNMHIDKIKVVKEIRRVLRLGGHYMMTENTFREDNYKHTFPYLEQWNENLDDGYSFTSLGWEKYLGSNGFDLVHFSAPSEYLFVKRS